MSPTVTIGFLPRERFITAAESLASLFEKTPREFELLVVDAAIPERYMREMRAVLDQNDNWRILRSDRHLRPAESKNLILGEATGDYLCLLENDNLFSDGWLDALLDACETHPADVAAPLIREGREDDPHFDAHLGSVVPTGDGRLAVEPLTRPRNDAQQREEVDFVETHCLLFRRSIFDRIGPFDEELNTRDEVDLSLALRNAGAVVVLEPRAIVNFLAPTSAPEPDELPFYLMRWDLERAAASRERIKERWSLVETPGDLGFVRYRNLMPRLSSARTRLEDLIDSGHRVVLIDDGDWFDTEVTKGLPIRPFPDFGGHFGGFPESEGAALEEFGEAENSGATAFVVGWPARWWFDYLPALRPRLADWAESVQRDDLLEVYVRPSGPVA